MGLFDIFRKKKKEDAERKSEFEKFFDTMKLYYDDWKDASLVDNTIGRILSLPNGDAIFIHVKPLDENFIALNRSTMETKVEYMFDKDKLNNVRDNLEAAKVEFKNYQWFVESSIELKEKETKGFVELYSRDVFQHDTDLAALVGYMVDFCKKLSNLTEIVQAIAPNCTNKCISTRSIDDELEAIYVAKWTGVGNYDYIVQLRENAYKKLCDIYPAYNLESDGIALKLCDGARTVLISRKRNAIYPLKDYTYAYGSLFNSYPPYEDLKKMNFEEWDFKNLNYEENYFVENRKKEVNVGKNGSKYVTQIWLKELVQRLKDVDQKTWEHAEAYNAQIIIRRPLIGLGNLIAVNIYPAKPFENNGSLSLEDVCFYVSTKYIFNGVEREYVARSFDRIMKKEQQKAWMDGVVVNLNEEERSLNNEDNMSLTLKKERAFKNEAELSDLVKNMMEFFVQIYEERFAAGEDKDQRRVLCVTYFCRKFKDLDPEKYKEFRTLCSNANTFDGKFQLHNFVRSLDDSWGKNEKKEFCQIIISDMDEMYDKYKGQPYNKENK